MLHVTKDLFTFMPTFLCVSGKECLLRGAGGGKARPSRRTRFTFHSLWPSKNSNSLHLYLITSFCYTYNLICYSTPYNQADVLISDNIWLHFFKDCHQLHACTEVNYLFHLKLASFFSGFKSQVLEPENG